MIPSVHAHTGASEQFEPNFYLFRIITNSRVVSFNSDNNSEVVLLKSKWTKSEPYRPQTNFFSEQPQHCW